MNDLEKDMEELFGLDKKKEDLHPPIAPKPKPKKISPGFSHNEISKDPFYLTKPQPKLIVREKPEIDFDDLPGYKEWCKASETKRFYYFTKLGKTHRGSSEKMFTDLSRTQEQLEIVKTIPKYEDYKEVVQELKIVLQERKAKVESSN